MYCKYCGNELNEDGLCEKCRIVFETEPQQPVIYVNNQITEKEVPPVSGAAVTGFISAILYLFFDGGISIVLFLLALITSFVGMSHTGNGTMRGRGYAVVGLIITIPKFVLAIIVFVLAYNGYY